MKTNLSIKNIAATTVVSLLAAAIVPLLASAQTAPTITSLSPTAATVGGSAYSLIVNGSGFVDGAIVNLNGSARTTSYISSNELIASINSADLYSSTNDSVTVTNPGGYMSNAVTLTVYGNTPVISSISPSSMTTGSGNTTVNVMGYGFLTSSGVDLNGSGLSTIYISPVELSATVPSSYFNSTGTYSLTVVNPGVATSNTMSFVVSSVSSAPFISSISPSVAYTGSGGAVVSVLGTGFGTGSVVEFNGVPRPTTVISSTDLVATLPASDFTTTSSDYITVVNPGTAASNAALFTVSGTTPSLPNTGFGPTSQGGQSNLAMIVAAGLGIALVSGLFIWKEKASAL